MNARTARRWRTAAAALPLLSCLFASTALTAPAVPVAFTILHTNDFHGQLEPAGSNPGSARVAQVVNDIRTAAGAANVLLVDSGDQMQGSLLSNLRHGLPTIAAFNAMGYSVATFGNHEFDWGQTTLAARTAEAAFPYVTANIVKNDTGDCATAGWTKPDFADNPFEVRPVGTPPNAVNVAFIGVTTTETPTISVAAATAGLCFKDPADAILHHYAAMKAQADVIVVLSHLGFADGGYGYGLPVDGDQSLAARLNAAGSPVDLIVGGHSHTSLFSAVTVGGTAVVQASHSGRTVGRADVTVGTDGSVGIVWSRITGFTAGAMDPAIDALVTAAAADPDYLALVNRPIGYSAVDLARNGAGDNMMGAFIDDAIYEQLNADAEPANDVDLVLTNAGALRTDWCYVGDVWTDTGCAPGSHQAGLLTYGNLFAVLPSGSALVVGRMTGAQILEALNHGPNVATGVLQPAGLRYGYYAYRDANPGPQPYAWGALDVTVYDRTAAAWEPLDLKKTYAVGANELLAPAGGDGYGGFTYMINSTFWGDMLEFVVSAVADRHGTAETAYAGPNGDGTHDGRIARDGTDAGGSIVPVTLLHHNDAHGNLPRSAFVGYTQLASLIRQERLHNPTRTLLLASGDAIQGDAMMYYFRTAPTGFAADGTPLAADLRFNPLIKAFNSMGYDALTLGEHEFSFGRDVFAGVLGQASFPLLQANVGDDGSYGLAAANVLPSVTKTIGAEGITVAILGIGNHLVPNFELPGAISGLSFGDPLAAARELSAALRPASDVVVALTHIGFTEDSTNPEVDSRVDTALAATVTGLDAIIGGHSHTDPSRQTPASGAYRYLPAIIADPDGKPVVISQAHRSNNTLGETVLGLRARAGGGHDVVSRTGRSLSVTTGTAEDPAVKAIADPFVTALAFYKNRAVGSTTAPVDTLQAFTQETNGANLQADAAVHELETVRGIPVDLHLAGAAADLVVAAGATPASPATLKVSDLLAAMPSEHALVVVSMNGPQLKAVLERSYRNYFSYKYVPGFGGYAHATVCLLDTDSSSRIVFDDRYPEPPDGDNVVSLTVNGQPVDLTDATRYYSVSTVDYLAIGSCNFNDGGVTIWPLDQIVQQTQYYARDAVIGYIDVAGVVAPVVDGRLTFLSHTISGTLGVPGAGGTVTYTGGSTAADAATGDYSFRVPAGWSGTVTPSKPGIHFTPAGRSYTNVVASVTGQDYAMDPTPVDQTIDFADPGVQTFGASPTLAASASSGLPVSFTSSTTGVCTVTAAGALTFVAPGTCTIDADQAGNSSFFAAPRVTRSFAVQKAAATVTLGNLQVTYDGLPKPAAAGTAPAGLAVTVTYDGLAAAPTHAGSYAVVATVTDAIYQGTASGTLVIAKAKQSIGTISFSPNSLSVNRTARASATATSGLGVLLASATPAVCTVVGTAVTGVAEGACTVAASQGGNIDYEPAPEVRQTLAVTLAPVVVNDFDGDGRSDIGCYSPASGTWYGFNSSTWFWTTQFGFDGTVPVTGDFDGDGTGDIGVYDPPTGSWYLFMTSAGYRQLQFGFYGTVPVVGDFDGDGTSDIGVYYPAGGDWYVFRSTAGFWQTRFGYQGTIPVVGDFDGDGRDDIGCYYPPAGAWYVYRSAEGFWQTTFGYEGTIPVVGDFDGDGASDIGCYYPAGGNWYFFRSTEGFRETGFGYAGTEPVVGDFDGDGRDDFGVYHPPSGDWHLFKSTEGYWQTDFGYEGTIPIGGTLR